MIQKEKQELAAISETSSKIYQLNNTVYQLNSRNNIVLFISIFVITLLIFFVTITRMTRTQKKNRILAKNRELQSLFIGMGEKRFRKREISSIEVINDIEEITNTLKEDFHECFTDTILQLSNSFQALTKTEIQYSVMIALGISSDVIADLMGVQQPSLRKVKQRVRNKLGLKPEINIEKYLQKFITDSKK